ncbi:MAG: hypothetical protein QMD97_00535 [Candidatus Aenigmarchaeota archaeon]|nr:hypothetical protein [Candidatus Aenigmarchaeota archaeon]
MDKVIKFPAFGKPIDAKTTHDAYLSDEEFGRYLDNVKFEAAYSVMQHLSLPRRFQSSVYDVCTARFHPIGDHLQATKHYRGKKDIPQYIRFLGIRLLRELEHMDFIYQTSEMRNYALTKKGREFIKLYKKDMDAGREWFNRLMAIAV